MKKVIKKITIISCAFILAFSSVTSYKFYNDDVLKVNAGFVDIRHKTMEVLAVVLALLGVGLSEIQESTVDYIYNNLEDNTKAIVNTVASTVTDGFALIQETDFKELALELIKDYNLATMELGKSVAITQYAQNVLDQYRNSVNYLPYNYGALTSIYSGSNQLGAWQSNYRTFTFTDNNNLTRTYYEMDVTLYSNNQSISGSFVRSEVGLSIPIGNNQYTAKINYFLTLVMGSALTPAIQGGPYLVFDAECSVISGSYNCLDNNGKNINDTYYIPQYGLNTFTASSDLAFLTTGGLTLPAPAGGWDTDDAGDIDVPNDYTKRILEGLGLGGLVLGGLNGQTLEDLKNKGPNDVVVDQETPTPFDNIGENDTSIDIPDATDIPETNAGLGAWLGGALGALGGALTGALGALGNLLMTGINSILAFLSSILTAILGLAAAIGAVIASIFAPLFEWLTEISSNWDWLKNLLNWIKDFFQFLWEIIKFLMNLFRYLFNYFILLLDLLYTMFFSGLLTVLVSLSSRIKTLFSVLPTPIDTIAKMTYDVAIFGLILAIVRNVLFMFRGKK